MGFFSRLFSRKQADPVEPEKAPVNPGPVPSTKVVSHKVAGTSYRQDTILEMGFFNAAYNLTKRELVKEWPEGVTIYEYYFLPKKAELIPEPDNPEDPKAIKVLIDGVHVGYIKAGSCAHIHRLLRENRIEKIEPRIIGGRYKSIYSYDDDPRRVEDYEFEKGSITIGVRLDITELPKG